VALILTLLLLGVSGPDRTPPVFAGVRSAITCLAGPVGNDRPTTRYQLNWDAAHDNRTPASRLVYDVYVGARAGARFARLRWTTKPGATSFHTPRLSSTKAHWFLVRARDAAGNRDGNKHEVTGVNICD
jgi:hypothetical protein